MKKYKFTGEEMNYYGHILHRIEAIKDFGHVMAGDRGGWIEKEENLSHDGSCWVYNNAKVYKNAIVFGDAIVYGDARVFGGALIYGDAKIQDISDYIVFKNWWSSGRYFTWTRSNDMWLVGCFYGTGEELIAKAYKDSEISGKEYEKTVKYVETLK